MRSASRLQMNAIEFRRDERARAAELAERLAEELERARERADEWYVWIRDVWAPRRRDAS